MQQAIQQLPEIKLVGITCRTNNKDIFSSDPAINKIAATVQNYFHNGLSAKILHRKNPGISFCVYTNYESDFTGDYTYFIGEEVSEFSDIAPEYARLSIAPQNYIKFTDGPAPMPAICIDMWKNIWSMESSELKGKRAYIADFEVYDERSIDHNNVTLDIYIGIKN